VQASDVTPDVEEAIASTTTPDQKHFAEFAARVSWDPEQVPPPLPQPHLQSPSYPGSSLAALPVGGLQMRRTQLEVFFHYLYTALRYLLGAFPREGSFQL